MPWCDLPLNRKVDKFRRTQSRAVSHITHASERMVFEFRVSSHLLRSFEHHLVRCAFGVRRLDVLACAIFSPTRRTLCEREALNRSYLVSKRHAQGMRLWKLKQLKQAQCHSLWLCTVVHQNNWSHTAMLRTYVWHFSRTMRDSDASCFLQSRLVFRPFGPWTDTTRRTFFALISTTGRPKEGNMCTYVWIWISDCNWGSLVSANQSAHLPLLVPSTEWFGCDELPWTFEAGTAVLSRQHLEAYYFDTMHSIYMHCSYHRQSPFMSPQFV